MKNSTNLSQSSNSSLMKLSFIILLACSLFTAPLMASNLDLALQLEAYDADCGNANNGAVTSVVSGGAPPYAYAWSNGETTAGIVDLAPGMYSLTVTDAAQGTVEATVEVEQAASNITLQLNASYETCVGSCDGNVSVNASGGNGSLTYLWNTGETFVVEDDACAGIYTVTVTDEDGCSAVGSIELELSPEGIWLMTSGTDPTCATASNGTAHVSVMTGVAPYVIIWSDGQTGEDITGLAAGTYGVTVTDVNGCSNSDEVTIDPGTGSITLDMNSSYETCDGSCDGNVSVNASGGSGSYTYLWNTGETFVVEDNACAGTYTVTVTDSEGCSAVGSVELELSPEGVWIMASHTDVTCNGGNDGTAHVSVMSGEAPYTIVWSNGQTGEDATGLSAGTYTVTATDANGCSNTEEVIIGEPSAIEIVVNLVTDADCGVDNGAINIGVLGGNDPYTYAWSNGATTQDLNDLAAGDYTVTVTDADGCTAVEGPITVNGSGLIITLDDVIDATCGLDNGAINISVGGGLAPYSFTWSNGATTEDISNLGAGDYTVTVTDANGCSAVEGPITVNETSSIIITLDEVIDAQCGVADGAINISVGGGTPGYTFAWSNSASTEDISGLTPGDYFVTVTDSDACTATMGPITVGEEDCCDLPVIASIVIIEASCGNSDGSVAIEMVGNNADYSYDWTPNVSNTNTATAIPAGIYTIVIGTISDPTCPTITETLTVGNRNFPDVNVVSSMPASCGGSDGSVEMSEPTFIYLWCNGSTVYNPNNLPAGICTVEITDPATGCTDYQTVIIEQGELTSEVVVNNYPDCGLANGSVTINISGGSGTYTYDWGNGNTTNMANNLSSGSYSVTVADANAANCETIVDFILIDNVPGATIVITEPITTTCVGSDDATVVYDITYETGFAQPASIEILDMNGNAQTNGSLAPGTYCIVVTDANGCLAGQSCFDVVEPDQMDMDIAIDDTCPSPSINIVEIIGGNGGYTFAWSNGATTQNITDLEPGTYGVTVTDINGCSVSANNLIITANCCDLPVISSVVIIEASCGNSDGSVAIEMVGNNADYSYDWTPNVSNTNTATAIPAGIYTIVIGTISDPTCPTITETLTVGNRDFPDVNVVSSMPASCGGSDGSVEMSEPTFIYLWCNGSTVYNPDNLPAGMCVVEITDPATGCTDYQTVIIEQGELMSDVIINNYPDCGLANGSVTINISGGSGMYTYDWGNGNTTNTADNLPSGAYSVTVTDANAANCETIVNFILIDNVPGATIVVTEPISTTCVGSDDATVVYDITYETGFAQPPSIEILDVNGNTQTNGSLTPGTYCIVVTDANGCLAGQSCFDVVEPGQIDMDIAIDDTCPSPSINIVEIIGGNGGYTFAWSNGATTQNITDLEPGTYGVTVTDINGCSVSANNLTITAECDCPDINIESVVIIEATCGNSDGRVCIEMVGDEAGYSYDWDTTEGTPNANGNCRDNLPAGAYTVTISDIDEPNCPPIIETFTIGNSDFPLVTIVSSTPATCQLANGSIEMSEQSFDYVWCNGETGYNPMALPAGPCVVMITDPATGCVDYQTVIIEEENPLMVTINVDNEPDCGIANGSITVNVGGGSGDYTYEWSNGATTATLTDIPSGSYCVTVTDNGPTGCVSSACIVLNDNVPGATITVDEPVSTNCIGSNDGTVVYDITYDAGFAGPEVITIVCSDGNTYDNGSLPPGNCCIIVTDANGCVAASECFDVLEPAQIDLDLAIHNTCDPTPGIEVVEVLGGTPGYTFDWADLPGTDNPEDRPDLETGSYNLTVTDSNGCSVAANDLMVIDTCSCPPMIISSVVVIESSCGDSIGQATVNVVGSGYTYEWSAGVGTVINNGITLTDIPAGTYSVTITNASQPQCNIIEELSVGNSDGPESAYNETPSLCGGASGSISFTNLNYEYDYEWSGGTFSGAEVTGLAAGTYFVTITDPNDPDCYNVKTIVIEEMPSFTLDFVVNQLPDCNESNGSVTVMPSVAGNYTYSWGNSTADNLSSGVYVVTVTDNNSGCTATNFFTLLDDVNNAMLSVDAEAFISCPGSTDGTIVYDVTNPGDFNVEIQDINGVVQTNGTLVPGNYCVIARDVNGCIAGAECVEVKSPSQIDVDIAVFDENVESLVKFNWLRYLEEHLDILMNGVCRVCQQILLRLI